MKNYSISNYIGKAIIISILIFSLTACAKKISFQGSSVVPAARGSVKIKKDKNKNYSIEVSLYNLAEVKRLEPPRQAYVVWMETEGQITKNIGQINSAQTMISKKLKASLQTVSSFKPLKIFVTAEEDATVQYPGSQVIISTDSF